MHDDQTRRQELARFLRSRRDRLAPSDLGLEAGGRRRAPGLRREEVAREAGISTTWYVWLEQGREITASAHAIRALARALRLSHSEQAYLFQLARPDLGWRGQPAGGVQPSAGLLGFIDGLAPHPAYVLDRYWHVVAQNRPAHVLFGDFADGEDWSGNLLARLFLDESWRTLFADWEEVARSSVAQFRLAVASFADDPVLRVLLKSLSEESSEFGQLWNERALADPPIWRKSLVHAVAGPMGFDFATLQPKGRDADFLVSIYTPADAETSARFRQLLDGTGNAQEART